MFFHFEAPLSTFGFFLLASLLAVARGRPILAGAMVGLSLWLKIPGVLALPALALALAAAGHPWRVPEPAPLPPLVSLPQDRDGGGSGEH